MCVLYAHHCIPCKHIRTNPECIGSHFTHREKKLSPGINRNWAWPFPCGLRYLHTAGQVRWTHASHNEAKAHQLNNNSRLPRSQSNHISFWRRVLRGAVIHIRCYFCSSSCLHSPIFFCHLQKYTFRTMTDKYMRVMLLMMVYKIASVFWKIISMSVTLLYQKDHSLSCT